MTLNSACGHTFQCRDDWSLSEEGKLPGRPPLLRAAARRGGRPLQKIRETVAGTALLGLLGGGKQQLITVGIDDLDHVVTPPGLLARNRALDDFTAKRGESSDGQFHEQARLVSARGFLAKDDLASRAIDLADPARAVALMPSLLEAEYVDVEAKCAVHVSNEEHGTGVPPVSDLLGDGCLGHGGSWCAQLVAAQQHITANGLQYYPEVHAAASGEWRER